MFVYVGDIFVWAQHRQEYRVGREISVLNGNILERDTYVSNGGILEWREV